MARRGEHSQEQIKAMVLTAAENLVQEEGFAGLKVRKIAMEIGYTVGSIYMVYDNLADLITHIKARTLDDLTVQLNQVSPQLDAEQQLINLASTYLSFADQNFNRWRMIFEHNPSDDTPLPEWYQHKVEQIFQRLEKLFKQLAPETTATEQHRAARALWSGIHGVCILSLTGKLDIVGVQDVENTVILLTESFIQGWTTHITRPI